MLTLCRLVTIARSLQNILWSSEVAGVHVRSNAPYVRRRTPRVHGAALTNVVSTTREFPPAYLGPALERHFCISQTLHRKLSSIRHHWVIPQLISMTS
jgi:hypothetical protein